MSARSTDLDTLTTLAADRLVYEVSFAGLDDGLCASRAGASYFVADENEARKQVARHLAAGFDASYSAAPASWLEGTCLECKGSRRVRGLLNGLMACPWCAEPVVSP